MKRQARVLAYNTTISVVAMVVEGALAFYVIRFLLASLGDTAYGVWTTVAGAFAYAGLLQIGLSSSVNWLVPGCLARNDQGGLDSIVSTALAYYVLVGAVVLVVTLSVSWWFPLWFNVPEEFARTSIALCLIVGSSLAIRMPLNVFPAALSGFQEYVPQSVAWMLISVLRLALVVLFVSKVAASVGTALLAIAFIHVGADIVNQGFNALLTFRRVPGMRLGFSRFQMPLFKTMVAYGFNTMLYVLSVMILVSGTYVMISILLGPDQVAWYVIPITLVTVMQQIVFSMVGAIKPAAASLHALGEMDRIRVIFLRSQKYSVIVLVPMTWFLIVMSGPLIGLWITDPAKMAMAPVAALLAVAYFFYLAQQSAAFVLIGLGKHRVFGILTACSVAACLVLDIIYVKVCGWGLWGIAIGTAIPMMVAAVIVLPNYTCRVLKLSRRRALKEAWLKPMIIAVPVGLLTVALYYGLYPSTWPRLLAEMALIGGAAMLLNWRISLEPEERQFFLGLLRLDRFARKRA
jgi:O-antigen/teichoic acid export membrane protein